MNPAQDPTSRSSAIRELHQLYSQITGQTLRLRFDRERLWFDFLQAGFNQTDLKRVLSYLQTEIRAARRNVGALKLSNLLQLDRFEEDLHISRVRLSPRAQRHTPLAPAPAEPDNTLSSDQILQQLKALRQTLHSPADPPTNT
jgi:hypothetical protein